METILITGANGQVGREFRKLAANYPNFDFLFVTREQLSIDNEAAVKQYFSGHTIDYCVNCGAYTAVDKAETETEAAYHINADAVGYLAAACKEQGAFFIHISTDYVFDGNATAPYQTDHTVSPVNLYGASKLKGEELAISNNPGTVIIRTSWVYSSFGNNFVKTMLRLMTDRDSLNVVSDQQGCPTYAADLAEAIMQIVSQQSETLDKSTLMPASNIYHYSNTGVTNWYEFAVAIRDLGEKTCSVNPITTTQYPTPAKRPAYSVMDTSAIQKTFNIAIPAWKESLEKCIAVLKAEA